VSPQAHSAGRPGAEPDRRRGPAGPEVSVTGGTRPGAGGDVRERAETYLRLLAEAELRRAAGSPPIRRHDPRNASLPLRAAHLVLPPAAAVAGRAMRPLYPVARRVLATRERVQGRALPAAGPAARWALGTASGIAAAVTASAGAVERAGWQVRRFLRRGRAGRRFGPDPGREGLDRVGVLAAGFAAAELIDLAVAESIVEGLELALVVRSRISPLWPGLAIRRSRRRQQPSLPAGPVRAWPLGQSVIVPSEDGPIHLSLLALVLASDRAEVTVTGQLPGPAGGTKGARRVHGLEPLGGSATDDRGRTYRAHFTGSWDTSSINGALALHPVPPPGSRWLDITIRDGEPVRVPLAASQPPYPGQPPPAGQVLALGPPVSASLAEQEHADPVERLIDSLAEGFLGHCWLHSAGDVAVPDLITALREIGAVSPDTPSLRRLAALLRRLGSDPPELSDVPSSDLPESWSSVLDSQDATDGRAGVSPLAVVFPEIDEIVCVLTGLRSAPDSASLQLVGWGWPDQWPGSFSVRPWAAVWARDDTGRWHVAAENGASYGDGHADITLRLTPPLHPDATTLEITLIGKSARAVATVVLAWQDPP
jgi:hypothetical protein